MSSDISTRSSSVLGLLSSGAAAVVIGAAVLVPTSAQAATRADGPQVVGPLVTETSTYLGSATFSAPSAAGAGQQLAANRAATLADARAKAVQWILPAAGSTSTVRPSTDPDLCLTAGTTNAGVNSRVTLEPCAADQAEQQFRQASNAGSNNPIGTGLQSVHNGGFLGLYNNDDVMRLQTKEIGDRIPTISSFVATFSAELDRVDTAARTAHLRGTGKPGARIVLNGRAPVPVQPDGTWAGPADNLALGANPILVEQYDGTEKTAETTLSATITAAPLTFTATFPAAFDSPVQAQGTAQPGAEVRLFTSDGRQIGAPTTAHATTGAWSTSIPAPNAAGGYEVTAAQFLAGLRDDAHDVSRTVDYGAGVAVSTPDDGDAHRGGPLEMTGTGEPFSSIEVHEITGGTDRVIGRSADGVLPDRAWTVTTDDLDRAEHVLRVVQKSRGANSTTTEVTINPGETGTLAPVAVTAPTTVTPGLVNTFTGTGEPDATYEVLNVSNNPIDKVESSFVVDSDGNWSFQRPVTSSASDFRFKLRQTKDDLVETSPLFTIAANAGLDPVVVDTDAVVPGIVNTFEGSGPAGATFVVLNSKNEPIRTDPVTIGADGRWTFDQQLTPGILKYSFKLEVTVEGFPPYTTRLWELIAATH